MKTDKSETTACLITGDSTQNVLLVGVQLRVKQQIGDNQEHVQRCSPTSRGGALQWA